MLLTLCQPLSPAPGLQQPLGPLSPLTQTRPGARDRYVDPDLGKRNSPGPSRSTPSTPRAGAQGCWAQTPAEADQGTDCPWAGHLGRGLACAGWGPKPWWERRWGGRGWGPPAQHRGSGANPAGCIWPWEPWGSTSTAPSSQEPLTGARLPSPFTPLFVPILALHGDGPGCAQHKQAEGWFLLRLQVWEAVCPRTGTPEGWGLAWRG